MLKGAKHSAETRERMSKSALGKRLSKETRQKLSRIAKERGFGKWMNGKKHSDETIEKMRHVHSGPTNYLWKGELASIASKHNWLYRKYGKASRCEKCAVQNAPLYEWANVSGKYRRDRNDYIQLCVPCHRKMDDNVNKSWAVRKGKKWKSKTSSRN